jgi:hypothetical protein
MLDRLAGTWRGGSCEGAGMGAGSSLTGDTVVFGRTLAAAYE